MDGASGWRRFWHITLPLLRPVIAVSLILRTTFAFMVFDEIFAITQGGPGNATWVAAWYTYRAAFQPPFNIGLGAASAWVLALILGVVSPRLRAAARPPAGGLTAPGASPGPLAARRLGLWARNLAALAFLLCRWCRSCWERCSRRRRSRPTSARSCRDEPTLANFQLILSGGADRGPIFEQVTYLPKSVERFPAAFLNSLIVGLAGHAAHAGARQLSAYTVARLNVAWVNPGSPPLSLAARLVPLIVLMVPLYVLFRRYGLLNSLSGVVLAEVGLPAALRQSSSWPPTSRRCRPSWRTPRASTAARASARSGGSCCPWPRRAWPRAPRSCSSSPGTSS